MVIFTVSTITAKQIENIGFLLPRPAEIPGPVVSRSGVYLDAQHVLNTR